MMNIPKELIDFIESHSPFDLLESEHKQLVCKNIEVVFYRKNHRFTFSEKINAHIHIIKKGAVEIREHKGRETSVIDFCTRGEFFGLRPVFSVEVRELEATITEDTILYRVPLEVIQFVVDAIPEFGDHLKTFFSGSKERVENIYNTIQRAHQKEDNTAIVTRDIAKVRVRKKVIACTIQTTIRQAAISMEENRIGSIVVVSEANHPIGIITNQDFRAYITRGNIDRNASVREIMSHPVKTILCQEIVVIECLIKMIEEKCHHLCVTTDGTPDTEVVGMISKHDLMLAQGETPEVILREIKYSSNTEELAILRKRAEEIMIWYLQKNIHTYFVTSLMTTINDTIIRKCIKFALGGIKPPVPFSWLSLGSQGRGEQVLTTDQDNMLIYQDTDAPGARAFFLKLATSVNQNLLEVGFAYDTADILARNEQWCQPLSKWKQYFKHWIEVPDPKSVMKCTIFFDYRSVYGDDKLAKKLDRYLEEKIKSNDNFFGFLMKNALGNPSPLGMFNQFLIEKKGNHVKEFDLKLRAIMPLVDAARILTFYYGIFDSKNTLERFKKLKDIDHRNETLYENAMEAYKLFIKYRSLVGYKRGDSGRYIVPEAFNTLQKRLLKDAFKTVFLLQDHLKFKFRKYAIS